jgi:hypothetical protein
MRILLIFIAFFSITTGFSQTKSEIIQQRIEFIAEDLETEDLSLEDLFENLSFYYDNPLNLNAATKDELEQLLLLSEIQIVELLRYREETGPLETIYTLLEFTFWDAQTVEMILPFVKISKETKREQLKLKDMLKESKGEVLTRWIRGIEEKAGYADVPDSIREQSNSYYWGSPDRVYNRVRMTYRTTLSVGVTMEKDPGEQLFGKTQPYGFDFYSAHAFYKGSKFVRKVALGDYHMEIGQGLAFWSGFAFGKTADAQIRRNARGLRPYASVDEARFLRGAGIELGYRQWSLTTFASVKGMNGSIQQLSDTLEAEELFTASSINISGLHRTTSEIARKNSMTETIFGSYLKYAKRSFHFGVSAIQHMYSVPLVRADRPYNRYEFSGSQLFNISADYSYIFRNVSTFGEIARSGNSGSFALLQGISVAIDNKATISLLYRNYSKDYHTFYSAGFGERVRTINEEGLFMGARYNFSKKWMVNTFADIYKLPWLTFRTDKPSTGHDLLGQVTYKPNTKTEFYIRYRERRRMQNYRDYSGVVRPLEDVFQRNYRFNFNYRFSPTMQWKTRIEYVTVERSSVPKETGFVMSQDIIFRSKKSPIDVSVRYALFDTDSFDSRLFVFESNLLNVFSIPAYFNEGSRYYILLHYNYKDKVDIWARYAAFVFANQGELGSGPERIQGNTRSEIGVQLRIRF